MPGEEFAEGGGPAAIRDLGMLLLYFFMNIRQII